MATDTIINNNNAGDNAPELARVIIKNWHIVFILVGLMGSVIFSWAHFQAGLNDVTQKVSSDELQAAALSANVNAISPQVSAINAKLDIILKHDGL